MVSTLLPFADLSEVAFVEDGDTVWVARPCEGHRIAPTDNARYLRRRECHQVAFGIIPKCQLPRRVWRTGSQASPEGLKRLGAILRRVPATALVSYSLSTFSAWHS